MKIKKIIILALFLSLLLIGTANAAIVKNDTNTQYSDVNQIDELNAKNDQIKIETFSSNEYKNQQDTNLINENEIKEKNTVLATDNINETKLIETNNQITVNDYDQLYNQIENLKEQGTSKSYVINLNPKGNFTITDAIKLQGNNSPTKDITLNGNGVTIDGKNSKYFLTIFEGYSVTLNNLNFINNLITEDGGGAIAAHTGSELNINNCNFTGCRAFNETESIHAGVIRMGYDAILHINNSIFRQNSASYGAGAIVIGGTLTEYNTCPHPDLDPTTITPTSFINNCQFIDNTAGHGGAVNIEEYCSAIIINCTFNGNSATDLELGLGGAICSDIKTYTVIINNTFKDNFAKQLGGAVCTDSTSCLLSVNNTFENNFAEKSGGGIYTAPKSQIKIENNIFIKNEATFGSALCTRGRSTLTVTNCIFSENNATDLGGAISTGENNIITINNGTFNKNQGKLGGAICLGTNSNMNIEQTTFTQNNAENGGAIYGTKNNNIIMKNIELTNNIATKNGGAIITGENTALTTTNTTFTTNKANLGGAILTSVNSNMILNDTIFTQNNAENGGAIYTAKNNNIQIKNTELTNNTATTIGGAILTGENNTLTTTNTTFNINKANVGGAILSGINSKITTDSTTFTQNTANTNGGAIITKENNTITTTNTIFATNKANLGGAIFIDTNSKITTDSTTFTQNTANANGGAIITKENNTITTTNTIFTANKANLGGAICLNGNCELTSDKTIFTQNNATKSGGVIYSANKNKMLLTNSEMTNNVATTTGGAIFTGINSTLTASNTKFNKNTANSLGGAICGESGSVTTLANSEFNSNIANIGNAVYNPKQGTLVFKGNTSIASEDYLSNGELKIEQTINTKISIDSIEYSSGIIVKGKLVDEYNSPISSETVSASIENENIRANTDKNGQFIAKFENMNPGTYTATSTFNGNSVYCQSTVTLTEKVVDRQTSKITVADLSTAYSSENYLIITLVNSQNSPLTNMEIAVDMGSGAETYGTDNNGEVKIPTKDLPVKTYTANIRFDGSENYLPSNATAKITISKQTTQITATNITTTYNTNKEFVVTLKDGQNRPLTNTQITMDFGIGAESYTTDSNGQVKIQTNTLDTDTYDVKIKYKGNESYEQTNATAKITINKQTTQITSTDVTTTYNTNKDIVVTLKNNENIPIADEMIVVVIKTRSVEVYTTDKNGQITIPTEGLIPDTYNAKITYYGSENYIQSGTTSKITVNKDTIKVSIEYENNDLVITITNSQNTPLPELPFVINYGKGDKAYRTDSNGQLNLAKIGIGEDISIITVKYYGNEKYLPTNTTETITKGKQTTQITATDITTTYNTNKDIVVTLKNNENSPIANAAITVDLGTGAKTYSTDNNGQVKIPTKDLSAKTYTANIKFNGNDNYMPSNTTAKITINKQTTQITAADITTTYNTNKDIVVTLKNNENSPIANAAITVDLGTGAKTYSTDNNGQVKISTSALVPKTYTAKITFDGDENYMKSSCDAKVTVKKTNVKLTAKAQTFKKSLKTKKYTVTLKNHKNKVMKNTWVTLKVNKKTYKVKTNSKGQAAFKITNLKKKGKFTATITYKGDKYYNKIVKNIKITIK